MPTTSNFGWTTPADTDLVKDGAAAIRTLGNGIDTSLLDLKGGTSGQVLSKNSNTDLDYTWVTPNVGDITEVQAGTGISVASGTGPIPVITNTATTTIDAEGDLLVGDAADALQRLAIGSNGNILTVDTAVDGKIKWAAPAGTSFAGCSIYGSSSQSIADNTSTAITFAAELFDTDAYHSTSVNTSRITIPVGKAGYYWIGGQVDYAPGTTNKLQAQIRKNNGTVIATAQSAAGGDFNSGILTFTVQNLAEGDYIELFARQITGGSLNVAKNNETESFLVAYKVG